MIFVRQPENKWLREAKPGVPYTPPGGGKDFTNTSGGGSDILMIYTPEKSRRCGGPASAR